MALFGVQVVLTMIVASFLHKLSPRYYSFGRWFITRQLKYYTFVSRDETEIKPHAAANQPARNSRKNSRGSANQRSVINKKEAIVYVKECAITDSDLASMHYSEELKWMLDLLLATVVIFCATAVYFYLDPLSLKNQMNLSIIWICFLLGHIMVILFRLMQIYLDPKLPKERISQIALTMLMIVCLIVILVFDSSVFNFSLGENLTQINSLIAKRFNLSNSDSTVPMWCFKGLIGVTSSVIALVLVFPTLNYTRIHFELLKSTKSFAWKSLQNISFILPLVCGSLWIKGNAGVLETSEKEYNWLGCYKAVFIIVLCISRFILFGSMMQAYLNRAKENAIKNKHENETLIKHRMISIFIFYCCTATQYIGPVVLLLMSLFLYTISSSYFNLLMLSSTTNSSTDETDGQVVSLFVSSIFEGTFSFLTWWICFCMFILSSLGSIIHSYFQS